MSNSARRRKASANGGSERTASNDLASTAAPVVTSGQTKPVEKIKFNKKPVWLDNLLTGLFVVEVLVLLPTLHRLGDGVDEAIRWFCIFALVVLLVEGSKLAARVIGGALSRRIPNHPLSNPLVSKKFQEQSWQLVVHVLMFYLEYLAIGQENYFEDPESIFIPTGERATPELIAELKSKHEVGLPCWNPKEGRDEYLPAEAALVYEVQLAIWVYTAFVHRFLDEPRKDYFVMYLHHVLTLALIEGSAFTGMFRIGIVVLIVHDSSDIFVDLLKLTNYTKLEGWNGFFLSEISYITNLVSWMVLRLYMYPTFVLKACYYHSLHLCAGDIVTWKDFFFPPALQFYTFASVMLSALYLLHCYWYYLMLRIGYKIVTKGAHQAGREEYEGDSD